MENKNILITGGAGFIGSHLVEHLCKENSVVVIDDLSTGNIDNIRSFIDNDGVKFINGDVSDFNTVNTAMSGIDYVFHQAALVSVPNSFDNPSSTNLVNITGSVNVFQAALKNYVQKVVCASSCAVYGDSNVLPIDEDLMLKPISPYAISKVAMEYYASLYSKTFNLPIVCLRYFNVFGPRQDPHSTYAAVIPKFIKNSIGNNPLVVFGDGSQTRDFIFVEDVVQANIFSVEHEMLGNFNLGNGKQISINDLVEAISSISKKDISIHFDEPRKGEILHSYGNCEKIRKWGFKPRFDFIQGLEKTFEWFSLDNIIL